LRAPDLDAVVAAAIDHVADDLQAGGIEAEDTDIGLAHGAALDSTAATLEPHGRSARLCNGNL